MAVTKMNFLIKSLLSLQAILISFFLSGCLQFPATISDFKIMTTSQQELDGTPLRVTFFEVGLGDCILVETPTGEVVLIDGGVGWYCDLIFNYLESQGITRINSMIVTHPHYDHYGGFPEILERYKPDRFYHNGAPDFSSKYLELLNIVNKYKIPAQSLRRGDDLSSVFGPQVQSQVLYPNEKAVTLDSQDDFNDGSIVIKLVYGESSFLFTGDVEEDEEARLIELEGDNLKSDVLKLGHHASLFSGTVEFFETVSPQIAIAQGTQLADIYLFYPRPSYGIISRLKKLNVPLIYPKKDGTIQVVSDGKSCHWNSLTQLESTPIKLNIP